MQTIAQTGAGRVNSIAHGDYRFSSGSRMALGYFQPSRRVLSDGPRALMSPRPD